MNVSVLSRTTIYESVIEEAKTACNKALDELWDSSWIKDSISKRDLDAAGQLSIHAMEASEKSDVLLIVATAKALRSMKAALCALGAKEALGTLGDVLGEKETYGILGAKEATGTFESGRPEVIFAPETLDPQEHSKLLDYLEEKAVTLFAVSIGEEDLLFRANYAIYKQQAFRKGNSGEERERVFVAVDEESRIAQVDASENNYPAMRFPKEVDPKFLGNTVAVLFPLMVMGADVESYISGFYNTVASPEWDRDAGLYAFQKSRAQGKADYLFYQSELSSLCRLLEENAGGGRALREDFAPEDGSALRGFQVLIGANNSNVDIMTPSFEGCDSDGSLAQLNLSQANKVFFEKEDPGFKIEIDSLSAENIGGLMAFIQISMGIEKYVAQSK